MRFKFTRYLGPLPGVIDMITATTPPPAPPSYCGSTYQGLLNHATTSCTSFVYCETCRGRTVHACDTSRPHLYHGDQRCEPCKRRSR